jgi:hypothetical protein
MTTLAIRMVKGSFLVTGPDIEPMRFESRREAKNWCLAHHPGSPIKEVFRRPKERPPGRQDRQSRGGPEEDWLNDPHGTFGADAGLDVHARH